MARRTVIGITACNRQVGSEVGQAVMNRYAEAAMFHGDVAALLIPALPDLMDAAEVVDRLDAILLTGSPSNIEARRYGDDEGYGPFDAGRDATALSVIARMIEAGKPVFGICRGFQEINVALGGTLRRDVSDDKAPLRHHSVDDSHLATMFAHTHPVNLTPGGVLSTAFNAKVIEVNSVHYQGVGKLGDGLAVEATAPDGLVEGFSARPNGALVLAVQWHPEWQPERNPHSQAYFRLLGQAARGVV